MAVVPSLHRLAALTLFRNPGHWVEGVDNYCLPYTAPATKDPKDDQELFSKGARSPRGTTSTLPL